MVTCVPVRDSKVIHIVTSSYVKKYLDKTLSQIILHVDTYNL